MPSGETAQDARYAMEKLHGAAARGIPYHIALLDMCMPDENGEVLGSRIKADPALEADEDRSWSPPSAPNAASKNFARGRF